MSETMEAPAPGPDRLPERERRLALEVDGDRLMSHVREIARWVRLSGTEEELRAFRYIQGVLDGYGYETRLHLSECLISLPESASLEVIDAAGRVLATFECIAHSMSPSADRVEGELVYVPAARPADFAQAGAKGKIALLDGIAMPPKVRAAEDAGAIAQIHISGPHLHEMCISSVWGAPTPETAPLLPRTPAISIRQDSGNRLKAMLREGTVRVRLSARVDTRWRNIPTLVADLPGNQEDRFVMFTGHVDSWYHGAMDNGTANATMLEVARLVAARRHELRRGLRLCFWSGHSHGRYAGSTWYVDHHWFDLHERCVANVNIDSVGGRGAMVLTEAAAVAELRNLAGDVIGRLTGQHYEGERIPRAGDHSFHGPGVPAMFMDLSQQPPAEGSTSSAFALLTGGAKKTGGLGWWWHTPDDTIDKIDPVLLVRDARIYAVVIDRLLHSPALPHDYRATMAELQTILDDYRAKAGDAFDLTPVLEDAAAAAVAVADFYRAAEEALGKSPTAVEEFNRTVMRLSRALIPLSYTESGMFEHDRAMPGPPLPLLRLLNGIQSMDRKSDAYRYAVTALQRRSNAVRYALREARRAAEEGAARLTRS